MGRLDGHALAGLHRAHLTSTRLLSSKLCSQMPSSMKRSIWLSSRLIMAPTNQQGAVVCGEALRVCWSSLADDQSASMKFDQAIGFEEIFQRWQCLEQQAGQLWMTDISGCNHKQFPGLALQQMTLDKVGILAEYNTILKICQGADLLIQRPVAVRQI